MPWVYFFISAAIIVYAGTRLSRLGDQIAERSGLGGLWTGALLMAGATSLPEIFTTASAALLHAPDLAVGDLFGAAMTNMFTLALADLLHRQKRILQQAAIEHTLAAALAMVLCALAGLSILADIDVSFAGVGADTLTIAVVYALGMRLVYRQEGVRRRQKQLERIETEGTTGARRRALRRPVAGFAIASFAILAAAPMLASSAREIAEVTGIGTTFVGTFLLALTTSLPELVTSLAAVRLGAFDLAVGNLFGSNAFNMSALFVADMFYRPGPILHAASDAHVVTAFTAILLMNVALMGILYRAEKRFLLIEPDSFTIMLGYVLGILLVFHVAG